jgi:hypothetical protein
MIRAVVDRPGYHRPINPKRLEHGFGKPDQAIRTVPSTTRAGPSRTASFRQGWVCSARLPGSQSLSLGRKKEGKRISRSRSSFSPKPTLPSSPLHLPPPSLSFAGSTPPPRAGGKCLRPDPGKSTSLSLPCYRLACCSADPSGFESIHTYVDLAALDWLDGSFNFVLRKFLVPSLSLEIQVRVSLQSIQFRVCGFVYRLVRWSRGDVTSACLLIFLCKPFMLNIMSTDLCRIYSLSY